MKDAKSTGLLTHEATMHSDAMQIDSDAAIQMAVFTGNLLREHDDERHFWALTLLIANLFELVGKGATGTDKFVDGFTRIARHRHDQLVVHKWHSGCIARAIRNLVNHGLESDRRQKINYDSDERASVVSIGFIPASDQQGKNAVYEVDRVGEEHFRLRFSPLAFWSYVEQWHNQEGAGMTAKRYVLFEPGGRQVRGYSYGELVEVRYIDVISTGIEAADRKVFLTKLRSEDRDYLKGCRVGYVDDRGAGNYCNALEFLDGNEDVLAAQQY